MKTEFIEYMRKHFADELEMKEETDLRNFRYTYKPIALDHVLRALGRHYAIDGSGYVIGNTNSNHPGKVFVQIPLGVEVENYSEDVCAILLDLIKLNTT